MIFVNCGHTARSGSLKHVRPGYLKRCVFVQYLFFLPSPSQPIVTLGLHSTSVDLTFSDCSYKWVRMLSVCMPGLSHVASSEPTYMDDHRRAFSVKVNSISQCLCSVLSLSIHPWMDSKVFHILAVVNNAAMNVWLQIALQDIHSNS